MSASEKLKALERHIHNPVTADEPAATRFLLGEALPQIVAVTSAAEAVHYWLWERDAHFIDSEESRRGCEDAVAMLDAALSALEEALK